MDDTAARRLVAERDAVVAALRAVAERLAALAAAEAQEPLSRLRGPVERLVQEAVPVLGPLPAHDHAGADPSTWPTVVFVRHGRNPAT